MMKEKYAWIVNLLPFLTWLPLLGRRQLKADITAGIVAGIIIIPQAIALATLAGMPPEYGFYTAIFPVIITSFFGSSWHALSGPNTAIAILIAATLQPYASLFTADYIAYVITLTFMAGVIQLTFGLLNLGVLFNYFSHTVMIAMITGVGFIIIVQQIGPLLGLLVNAGEPIEDTLYQLVHSVYLTNGYELIVGAITIMVGVATKRWSKFPPLIAAVVVGMLAGWLIDLAYGSGITNIDKLGFMSLSAFPLSSPDFSQENFSLAQQGLLVGSLAIAFLGLMQSAVIARSTAIKSGQHINMNQEVVGQGLSNIAGGFLSCFASCGSFNRSAANLASGAITPVAGIISALVLGILAFYASDIMAYMPIAVMAGVLLLVGWSLINLKDIKKALALSTTRYIFLFVLLTTIFGGLESGVFLGLFLSIALYLRGASKPEIECLVGNEASYYYPADITSACVLKVTGNLFFASVPLLETVFLELEQQQKKAENLIIIGEYIVGLDDAAIKILIQEAKQRQANGKQFILWLADHKFDAILQQQGLIEVIGVNNIYYNYNKNRTNSEGGI